MHAQTCPRLEVKCGAELKIVVGVKNIHEKIKEENSKQRVCACSSAWLSIINGLVWDWKPLFHCTCAFNYHNCSTSSIKIFSILNPYLFTRESTHSSMCFCSTCGKLCIRFSTVCALHFEITKKTSNELGLNIRRRWCLYHAQIC